MTEGGFGYYGSRSEEAAHQRSLARFKSRERNAGLEGEEQQQRDHDRGPWYIKVDGVVLKQQGQPKVFNWRRGANNYALKMIERDPSLKEKIRLTKQL